MGPVAPLLLPDSYICITSSNESKLPFTSTKAGWHLIWQRDKIRGLDIQGMRDGNHLSFEKFPWFPTRLNSFQIAQMCLDGSSKNRKTWIISAGEKLTSNRYKAYESAPARQVMHLFHCKEI